MWLARDENGDIFVYTTKPYKCTTCWTYDMFSLPPNTNCYYWKLKENLFPEVTWSGIPKWIRFIKEDWISLRIKI